MSIKLLNKKKKYYVSEFYQGLRLSLTINLKNHKQHASKNNKKGVL